MTASGRQTCGDSDRACYVTPAHQFPLGGRMPVRRRASLLAWARARDALVLEDDYDGEFRYDVPPLTPLRSMPAAAGHVVYLGTSSKVLSRGLRVSWAVLPARFRAAMTRYLDQSGEEVSQVSAAFLASFISTGALTRHQSRAMRTYRARQARFVAACREHIPAARALGIEAGLHVTLVFGRPLDDVAAVARLADAGLACLPLSAFCASPERPRRSGLICGYSRLPETMADGAAALIGRVTSDLMPVRLTGCPEWRRTLSTDGETGVRAGTYSDGLRAPVGADDRQDPGPQRRDRPHPAPGSPGPASRTLTVHWPSTMSMASAVVAASCFLVWNGTSAERPGVRHSEIWVSASTASSPLSATAAVHDGRTVVGAGVEQGVPVDPAVDVSHAQRARGARGHMPQGTCAHRAVHQDPVACPAVEHRHHPRPAVGHRAQRARRGARHRVPRPGPRAHAAHVPDAG